MVFFYTNFVAETNAWWIRRVRPVWMIGVSAMGFFIYYRYYFFGKVQSNFMDFIPDEE